MASLLVSMPAYGEQAGSDALAIQQGSLDAGGTHTCALLRATKVTCWGLATSGRLGYGNTNKIGDDETPATVGTVDLGAGRSARAISAGSGHTCALLDNDQVKCWGAGSIGQLGYGNTDPIGDDETPATVGTVDLGAGRSARAISAGNAHTCALLDNGQVKCWGTASSGQLGYGNTNKIGDDETPATVGTVDLGAGRSARAISAGSEHTCALLDNDQVKCWGAGSSGRLGYGNTNKIGDDETPATVGTVDLGAGRSARAISAGNAHTCALLDNGQVKCWGAASNGQLGYGNTNPIGDDETPATVGTVDLGVGRSARAISAGNGHTCALLDNDQIMCWGSNIIGQLGYGNVNNIGDNEAPATVGTVDLGAGRSARAISADGIHTCALLDNDQVKCWGSGDSGRLGYGNTNTIGDNEVPATAGSVVVGAPVFAGVADLSLELAAGAVGQDRTAPVQLTLHNFGPETAVAEQVSAELSGLSIASASPSQGTLAGGVWSAGALAPGAAATLTLTLTANTGGNFPVQAEVSTIGQYDPDSIPANGTFGEDDRVSTTLTFPSPPPPPPPPPPAFGPDTLVSLKLASKRIPARGLVTVIATNRNPFTVTGALTAKAKRSQLGPKPLTIQPNTATTIEFKLTKPLSRQLKRNRKLQLLFTATLRDPATNVRTFTKQLTTRS